MSAERLQKFLARAGIASRRHAEELILAGRVRVAGRIVTELGTKIDPKRDRIDVDDKRVVADTPVYIVLHKPRGVMCTMSDPEGRPTVADLVRNVGTRVVPVGRLDFQTSGVLLFTNDGDFAAGLSHPSKQVEKVYVVKVQGKLDDTLVDRFRESIVIDGRATTPAEVRRLRIENAKTWVEVTLREGRNRQVRRLGESAGFIVMRLARTAYAGITADGLRPGEWRPLTLDELKDLKKNYDVPRKVRSPDIELVDKARVRRRPKGRAEREEREHRPSIDGEWTTQRQRAHAPDREESSGRRPPRARDVSRGREGSNDRGRGPAKPERGARGPERGGRAPDRDWKDRGRGPAKSERGGPSGAREWSNDRGRGPGKPERAGERSGGREWSNDRGRGPAKPERGGPSGDREWSSDRGRGPAKPERGARAPERGRGGRAWSNDRGRPAKPERGGSRDDRARNPERSSPRSRNRR